MSRPRQWRAGVPDDEEDDYSEDQSRSQVESSERPSGETSSSGVLRRVRMPQLGLLHRMTEIVVQVRGRTTS